MHFALCGGCLPEISLTRERERIDRRNPTSSDDQARQVYDYLFSTESELDRVLATFDRLPRKSDLTEEETLALRVRVLLDSNVWLAILTTDGFCRRVWRHARRACQFYGSEEIVSEIQEKLRASSGSRGGTRL